MGTSGLDRASALKMAADLWWKELKDIGGISPTSVRFSSSLLSKGIGHWSQMAWGKTTTVGCGYKSCPGQKMTLVVCNYRPTFVSLLLMLIKKIVLEEITSMKTSTKSVNHVLKTDNAPPTQDLVAT